MKYSDQMNGHYRVGAELNVENRCNELDKLSVVLIYRIILAFCADLLLPLKVHYQLGYIHFSFHNSKVSFIHIMLHKL